MKSDKIRAKKWKDKAEEHGKSKNDDTALFHAA